MSAPPPTDVMAYLGGSNSSLYSHLTQASKLVQTAKPRNRYAHTSTIFTDTPAQVLATIMVENPDASEADFFKLSRAVAENTLRWDETPAPLKKDVSALIHCRDLFKVIHHLALQTLTNFNAAE